MQANGYFGNGNISYTKIGKRIHGYPLKEFALRLFLKWCLTPSTVSFHRQWLLKACNKRLL